MIYSSFISCFLRIIQCDNFRNLLRTSHVWQISIESSMKMLGDWEATQIYCGIMANISECFDSLLLLLVWKNSLPSGLYFLIIHCITIVCYVQWEIQKVVDRKSKFLPLCNDLCFPLKCRCRYLYDHFYLS